MFAVRARRLYSSLYDTAYVSLTKEFRDANMESTVMQQLLAMPSQATNLA
jgi:hypothetical protein